MRQQICIAKHFTLTALVILFITLMWGSITKTAYAVTEEYNDEYGTWYYEPTQNSTAMLKQFVTSGNYSYVTIPSSLNGRSITMIGENAFKGKTDILGVTMPNTVKEMADNAFKGCINLSAVTLSSELTEIPYRAFSGCSDLTSVNGLQKNKVMKKIGYEAFYSCNNLTSVNIPESVTDIEAHAFYNCSKLESICFPTQIKSIKSTTYNSYQLFMGCGNLKYVFIPSGVTEIAADALDINGMGSYVPKIYGFNGTYAQDYAGAHGITFVPLDSVLNGISYDVSVTDGFIIMPNAAQRTSLSGESVGNTYPIRVDTTKIPPGKKLSYWNKTVAINAKHNSIIHYPFNETYDYTESEFTVETPEEAVKWLMDDIVKNETSSGYYTFSGSISFAPVYKDDVAYTITVTNGTADKETAKEGETVTVTAEEIIGKEFSYWEYSGFNVSLWNNGPSYSTGIFTMPDGNVTLTAKYTNRDKHGITTSIHSYQNPGSSNDSLATVTLDKTLAYYGETITGSITINPEAGSYSIRKNDCEVFNSTLNWIDDTHFSFVMPDLKTTLMIWINEFSVYSRKTGSNDYIKMDFKNNNKAYVFSDDDRYYCFYEILDYLKSQNKADYSVSGADMTIDINGDGSNDFTLDTFTKRATWLETCSIAPKWNYILDESAISVIREKLIANGQWLLYNELEILCPVAASDKGKQTIDMSSGVYKLDEDRDLSFMGMIGAKILQGAFGGKTSDDNKIFYLDIDNDGNLDLEYNNDSKEGFKVMDTTKIYGVFSLSISSDELDYLKFYSENNDATEYYSAFDIIFPEKKDPANEPTPTPPGGQNGNQENNGGTSKDSSSTVTPGNANESGNKLANTLTVKAKKVTVKFIKLKKKNQTVKAKKAFIVKDANGKVTYKKAKGNKKNTKKITVSKTGKIKIKKGLKKGTYKVKINVTAAGDDSFSAGTKMVTVKIKVK